MLTLFTTAKPFKGHNGIIQRNALQSWKLLAPDIEIIVFGDEGGSADICRELGLRHEPEVARTKFGGIQVDDIFGRAQVLAKNDVLCYSNCDIIFMLDFIRAVCRVKTKHPAFLLVGRRWDLDVKRPLNFDRHDWQAKLADLVRVQGKQRPGDWIDYFAFSRGFYQTGIPPFALGRTAWDNWLMWKACESGSPLLDASSAVMAVHQNHDYTHHADGVQGVWKGEDARRNFQLLGGLARFGTIADASLILDGTGKMRPNYKRFLARLTRESRQLYSEVVTGIAYKLWLPGWHLFLGLTRPLRHVLGFRSKSLRRQL